MKNKSTLINAAILGIMTAGTIAGSFGTAHAEDMAGKCYQNNSCKGQGGCRSLDGKSSCHGQNSCKNHVFKSTLVECAKESATVVKWTADKK